VVLQLDVEALFSEDLGELAGVGACLGDLIIEDVPRDWSTQTCRRGYQAGSVLLEHFQVDPGPVVEAFEARFGCQLQEIPISLQVFSQEQQVILTPIPSGSFSRRQVSLDPDHWMQPAVGRFPVPLEGRIHYAVISHGHMLYAQLLGPFDVVGHATEPVEQGVFGMEMEVREFSQRSESFRQVDARQSISGEALQS
jgi:hypothetical protein